MRSRLFRHCRRLAEHVGVRPCVSVGRGVLCPAARRAVNMYRSCRWGALSLRAASYLLARFSPARAISIPHAARRIAVRANARPIGARPSDGSARPATLSPCGGSPRSLALPRTAGGRLPARPQPRLPSPCARSVCRPPAHASQAAVHAILHRSSVTTLVRRATYARPNRAYYAISSDLIGDFMPLCPATYCV